MTVSGTSPEGQTQETRPLNNTNKQKDHKRKKKNSLCVYHPWLLLLYLLELYIASVKTGDFSDMVI